MYDASLLREKLEQILTALLRIQRRFVGISTPADFEASDANMDKLDAIAMMLIAIGENFKKIDDLTAGSLLARYPHIDWKGVKGVRDVLSHDYFDIDAEEIFKICQQGVPPLVQAVEQMLQYLI